MMPRKAVILVDSLSCACRLQQTHFSFVDRDLVLSFEDDGRYGNRIPV